VRQPGRAHDHQILATPAHQVGLQDGHMAAPPGLKATDELADQEQASVAGKGGVVVPDLDARAVGEQASRPPVAAVPW